LYGKPLSRIKRLNPVTRMVFLMPVPTSSRLTQIRQLWIYCL
jgi:hypothetical protein